MKGYTVSNTSAKEFIPSTMIYRKYKTFNIYRPKVIISTSSSIERVIGELETRNKNEAFLEAVKMVNKLKEGKL